MKGKSLVGLSFPLPLYLYDLASINLTNRDKYEPLAYLGSESSEIHLYSSKDTQVHRLTIAHADFEDPRLYKATAWTNNVSQMSLVMSFGMVTWQVITQTTLDLFILLQSPRRP